MFHHAHVLINPGQDLQRFRQHGVMTLAELWTEFYLEVQGVA